MPNLRGWSASLLTLLLSGLAVSVVFQWDPAVWADELLSRRPLPPSWRTEAELHDLFFWDGTTGWAVGDCGTILRTRDGGVTWQECQSMRTLNSQQQRMTPQMKALVNLSRDAASGLAGTPQETVPSPISASLTSVHFLDGMRGWAVGGYSLPYVDRSRAVVMKTSDGGATWIPQSNVMAPRLVTARFQGAARGWAFGDGGNLYKSGYLITTDGGTNWSTQDNSERHSWRAGSVTTEGFIGVDQQGTLRVFRGGKVEASIVQQRPLRRLNGVAMSSDQVGWAVGDAGTLLQTADGGISWNVPPAIAAAESLRYYDLKAVTCVGERVWFAGSPGSHVFCYDSSTGVLSASQTGTTAGLNRLVFNGRKLGWACGQFGTILTTTDEGETWQIRRGGNSQMALLFLNWDDSLPAVEAMARYGADEGLRAISCRIQTRPRPTVSASRSAEAVIAAGCLSEVLIDGVKASDGKTDWALIEQRLLQLIRQHHPRAIASSQAMLRLPDGTVIDVNELLQRTIRRAAATDQELQLSAATLTRPWQASQVMLLQPGGGHWPLADNIFLTKLNRLLADQVGHSRALYGSRLTRSDAVGFELLPCGDRLNLDDRGTLMDSFQRLGMQLPKRAGSHLTRGNLREVQAAMAKGQQVQSLLGQQVRNSGDQLVWQQGIVRLLQTADEETMGNWLGELAEQYFAAGNLSMTALTLEQLLVRVPHHGLAPAAQLWLAQFRSSRDVQTALTPPPVVEELASQEKSELAEIDELIRDSKLEATSYESEILAIEQDGMKKLVWVPKASKLGDRAKSKTAGVAGPVTEADFWQQASKQLNQVKQRDPELGALPQIRWLEAAATKQLGGWEAAEPMLQQLLRDDELPEPLRKVVQRTFKSETAPNVPNAAAKVVRAPLPPNLDGVLDDDVWRACKTSSEPIVEAETGDDVWLSYDDEYLYIAVECRKLSGVAYRPLGRARERDERLDDHDRVILNFDLDGDGYWPLNLTIDSRGALAEGCGATSVWNPTWYVAQHSTAESWSVEAAIPLSQFGGSRPESGARWGFGAERRAPWQAFNLWNSAAAAQETPVPLQVPLAGADFRWLEFE
jgi:photosystem II stability/assembly factor-like uncharacterized protein